MVCAISADRIQVQKRLKMLTGLQIRPAELVFFCHMCIVLQVWLIHADEFK